jgi:Cys-tRNA(Pro)/Cys-tRNA(Cys) deacylase
MSTPKLNSMRLLEQYKIPYEVLTYPDTIHDAREAAEAMGVPAWTVYKTLVVRPINDDKPMLVMVAADRTLDMKKVAVAVGFKKVGMVPYREAESLTELRVGGIGALALMHKGWRCYLDKAATELQHILINPGQRGMNVRVPVTQFIGVVKARIAEFAIADSEEPKA